MTRLEDLIQQLRVSKGTDLTSPSRSAFANSSVAGVSSNSQSIRSENVLPPVEISQVPAAGTARNVLAGERNEETTHDLRDLSVQPGPNSSVKEAAAL